MAAAVWVAAEGAVVAAAVAPDQEVEPEQAAVERGLEAVLGPEAAAWRVQRHVRRDPAQVPDSWEALAPRGRAPADRLRDPAVPAAAWPAGQGSAPAAA